MTHSLHTVLITGASAGIGKTTALHLAGRGYVVIGTSRRLERLSALFDEAEEQRVRLFGVELDPNSDGSVQSVMPGLLSQSGAQWRAFR